MFLQRATGLTKGNLSSHLTKLEDAGLVTIEKRFVRKKPNTKAALTPAGRQRIARHWDAARSPQAPDARHRLACGACTSST